MRQKPKVRWGALVSAVVTALGIVAGPRVLALLPPDVALVITGIGAACQAITKPVVRKEVER